LKSHKDLQIYNDAFALFLKVHSLSLRLPGYEKYELGSQLRRSADSVISNIVEGYDRKRYKSDFVRFLTYAHASNLETINHIEKINFLYRDLNAEFSTVLESYDKLGASLFRFIQYVEDNWR